MVALVGEPGVGKSRLVWEFTHSHRAHGWLTLESGSVSYGTATAYLPVIDLLKVYFQIDDRDDARKVREKVTGKLLTLDEALRATLPAFLTLLDVPVADLAWQALDPPLRRQRTLDAIKRLLLRESQVQPLLLVVEDLQWIDGETQALLDSLVDGLPSARIMLLVNYRPEYEHRWGSKTYYIQLRLDPLPPEGARELLHALLGDDPEIEPLKLVLIERTEGNPFFLEESVRTIVETGGLLGEPGSYRAARPLERIQVPATVQALLAARIDRLPHAEKRLLQSAAAIGKDVPFRVLRAVADLEDEPLHSGLAHLQAAEFLYETNLFPEIEYTFKHALTQEVAYGSLLQDRRRALHVRIAEAIERLYPERLTEQVDLLAHHAVRGELWEKAVSYARQAGARAFARSAHREAIASFEQALAALERLPESRARRELAIDLRLDLRNPLWQSGQLPATCSRLLEAEGLAQTLGDQGRLGWVSYYLGGYFSAVNDHSRAMGAAQRTLAISEAIGDFPLQVRANFRLSQACHFLGDHRRAADLAEANVRALLGNLINQHFGGATWASISSRWILVLALAELGAFAEGTVRGEEALRLAQETGTPIALLHALDCLGTLHLRKGDLGKATPLLEQALALCRAHNASIWFAPIASSLGAACALAGRPADAIALLEKVGEQFRPSYVRRLLGEAYLRAGRAEDALVLAVSSLEAARSSKERGLEAHALWLLGEIASAQALPDVADASGHYVQAMALAEELGMRPLIARCHLGLGKLYRRAGQREQAQEHLTAAVAMCREMDMRLWLEQAEVETEALAAPG